MSEAQRAAARVRWEWTWRPADEDKRKSGLSFTDILFGLVLAETLRRANELGGMTGAGRAHLGVALTLVTTSWIGYHNSVKRSDYRIHFFNLPLLKFVLDMSMVALYWIVSVNPEGVAEVKGTDQFSPSAELETYAILAVFILYLLWDLASWVMSWVRLRDSGRPTGDAASGAQARRYPLARHDWRRTLVTLAALLIALVIAGIVWSKSPSTTLVVLGVDLGLVALLITYRYAKDGLQG